MNETRGNSRTKPMNRGDFRGEINSLKDSEKTNEYWCICNKYNIFINKPYKTKKAALKTLKFLKKSKNPKGWYIYKRKIIEKPLF